MKTALRLPETLAVKAEAAVVLAALPFLTKRLRCHQVHIAWDLNSVPISLSILRHIPYMVLSAPHSHRNVALPGNHLLRETAGLLLRAGSTPQPLPDGLRCPPRRVSPPQHLGQTSKCGRHFGLHNYNLLSALRHQIMVQVQPDTHILPTCPT